MALSLSVKTGSWGPLIICLCFFLWQSLCTEGAESASPPSQVQRAVDLVLDCTYVAERVGHSGMFAGGFTREAALLVLRNVSVPEQESLDTFTDFQPQPEDNEAMIFEATVTHVEIPESEALLHADCNGQEVSCEISQYFPYEEEGKAGSGQEENRTCFISSIRISGDSFSVTVVMKTLPYQDDNVRKDQWHPRLKVPLSPSGTVAMTVEFAVFTHTPSMHTRLGSTVTLDCGLKLPAADAASVEWRIQHKGSGRSIYMYQSGTKANRETTGPRMDIQKLQDLGDASLIVEGFGVKDEGTYICLVSTHHYHAQQIIQVLVIEPPKVKLYSTLPHEGASTRLLICEISNYYPLDVLVKWTQKVPGYEGAIEISESYSTSHQQNRDGTFTISSVVRAKVPSPDEGGTSYTCSVSHQSLDVPVIACLQLDPADVESPVSLAGLSIATLIFFIAFCCFLSNKRRDEGQSQCRGLKEVDKDTPTPHGAAPQHKEKEP